MLWFNPHERQIRGKSDAYRVAGTLKAQGLIQKGDLVVAVHPEYGPAMRYYLGGGYRWADALGPVTDNRVFDWRDALDRFKAAGPKRTLAQARAVGEVRPAPDPDHADHPHRLLGRPLDLRDPPPRTPMGTRPQRRQELHPHRPGPLLQQAPLPRGVRAIVYLKK